MHNSSTHSDLASYQTAVLCIDERQAELEVRVGLLKSAGYSVFPAMNVNTAMQLFVANQIDLVLASQDLQGVSGAELSIFMKQVKPVLVVLLTKSGEVPAALVSEVDACMEAKCAAAELLFCLSKTLSTSSMEESSDLMLMEA